jgi:hypothetical protein
MTQLRILALDEVRQAINLHEECAGDIERSRATMEEYIEENECTLVEIAQAGDINLINLLSPSLRLTRLAEVLNQFAQDELDYLEALRSDLEDIEFEGVSLKDLEELEGSLHHDGERGIIVEDFQDYTRRNPDQFCPDLPEEYLKYIDWEMVAHDHCGNFTINGNDYYIGV